MPRRQVVRHLTLTQTFGGSNPSGAANSHHGRAQKWADDSPTSLKITKNLTHKLFSANRTARRSEAHHLQMAACAACDLAYDTICALGDDLAAAARLCCAILEYQAVLRRLGLESAC